MKKIRSLDNSIQVGIWTFVIALLSFLITIFCFFNGQKAIPLGFLLAGVLIGGLSILQGYSKKWDESLSKPAFAIASVIIKFVILAGVMVLLGFMYYSWKIHLFNLYCFIGIYTASILITIGVYAISKED